MPRLPATLDRDIDTSLPCSGPTPLAPPVLTRSLATAANQPVKRFVRLPLQRESSSLGLGQAEPPCRKVLQNCSVYGVETIANIIKSVT